MKPYSESERPAFAPPAAQELPNSASGNYHTVWGLQDLNNGNRNMGKRTGKPVGRPKHKFYSERFEDYISPEPNSGCWLFNGGWSQRGGYCQIWSNGKRLGAHRFAYEKYRGPIPPGMCVCHKCDVPCCVNPDHLILGTAAENIADKTLKNRQAKGIKIGISKLVPRQVLAIRASVQSCHSLGHQYGVDHTTIQHIRRRKTWKHLP